jgi:hypothetical protein
MFACPSPKNTNRAQLYLNKRGELMDRSGAFWGRSQIGKLAMDAMPPDLHSASGPRRPHNPLASQARSDHAAALKKLSDVLALPEEVADRIKTIIEEAEREAIQEYAASLGAGAGKGAAATDKNKGAGALDYDDDDDASVERRVRELLASKGLDDEAIEEALKRVRADREAARDSRPQNAIHGGRGGRLSGASKDAEVDLAKEYPGSEHTTLDVYGTQPEPDRYGYDPAQRLPGGGTSRRLSNDAAPLATDEDLAREYPGIENVIAGL